VSAGLGMETLSVAEGTGSSFARPMLDSASFRPLKRDSAILRVNQPFSRRLQNLFLVFCRDSRKDPSPPPRFGYPPLGLSFLPAPLKSTTLGLRFPPYVFPSGKLLKSFYSIYPQRFFFLIPFTVIPNEEGCAVVFSIFWAVGPG